MSRQEEDPVNDQHDRPENAPQGAKKPYRRPELEEHGSVRELTQGAAGAGVDGGTFS